MRRKSGYRFSEKSTLKKSKPHRRRTFRRRQVDSQLSRYQVPPGAIASDGGGLVVSAMGLSLDG
jgi:hypothetical protein